jgi:hypothetical protein
MEPLRWNHAYPHYVPLLLRFYATLSADGRYRLIFASAVVRDLELPDRLTLFRERPPLVPELPPDLLKKVSRRNRRSQQNT